MTSVDIQLQGDGCWPDLVVLHEAGKVHWHGQLVGVALLPDAAVVDTFTGIERKVPAVTLRMDVGDGTLAIAQMKLDMLETIVRAFRSRLEYLAEQQAAGKGEA
jgi:hypothetical protein